MSFDNAFETEDEFLDYCDNHSRTPRALFSIDHARRIYEIAELPFPENFREVMPGIVPLPYDTVMAELIDRITMIRGSITVDYKVIE